MAGAVVEGAEDATGGGSEATGVTVSTGVGSAVGTTGPGVGSTLTTGEDWVGTVPCLGADVMPWSMTKINTTAVTPTAKPPKTMAANWRCWEVALGSVGLEVRVLP